jgi:competence protein ComFC
VFCYFCFKKLNFKREKNIKVCENCFKNLLPVLRSEYIENCKVKSIFSYQNIIKKIILDFKFKKRIFLKNTISNLILENIEYINFDYIIYPPIHPLKLIIKGYSHMEEIAKDLAKKLEIKTINIFKIKFSSIFHMNRKKMNKKTREKQKNNFYFDKKFKNLKSKNFLLIDDVMTTGSTLKNCIEVLNKEKFKNIKVITLAKTLK